MACEVSEGEWVVVGSSRGIVELVSWVGIVVSTNDVGNLEGDAETAVGKEESRACVCEVGTVVEMRGPVGLRVGSEVGTRVGLTVGGRGGLVAAVERHGSVSSVCRFLVLGSNQLGHRPRTFVSGRGSRAAP